MTGHWPAVSIPEAAAIGAGAGALAGGLSGLLTKHGVSDEDAGYYEERINNGGIFLSVDTGAAGTVPIRPGTSSIAMVGTTRHAQG